MLLSHDPPWWIELPSQANCMGKKLWNFFRGKTMYLVTNDNTGEHDNDWALLLENHTPQILHCAWEWPLCGYVLGQICISTTLHSPHKTKLCNFGGEL
jgi:hypothetical protein